jgi:hypothetical protein
MVHPIEHLPIAEPGKASMPSPAAVAGALPLRAKAAEAPPETPAPIARREEASRPAPAAKAAAPVLAKASEPAAGVRATGTDGSLGQAAPSMAFARAQWRPAAHWKWLAALLLLLVVSQAGTIAWLALFDRASPHSGAAPRAATAPPAAPASAAPVPEPFVVRSLATSTPMLVGSETVTIRAGPSPDFASVGNLDAGTEVVASASADGPGGSSWIEITAANGAIGFVPDNMVQPRQVPVLTAEQAAPPEPAPTPKIKRAAASTQTPTKVKRAPVKLAAAPAQSRPSKIRRAVASKQSPTPKLARATRLARASRPEEAPAPPRIACILPGGGEVQATRSDCRAQSGIIYQ